MEKNVSQMCTYRIGDLVKIPRTDGRIHDAEIITLSYDKGLMSVQWIENGEIKGKEIDFDQIASINDNSSRYFATASEKNFTQKRIAMPEAMCDDKQRTLKPNGRLETRQSVGNFEHTMQIPEKTTTNQVTTRTRNRETTARSTLDSQYQAAQLRKEQVGTRPGESTASQVSTRSKTRESAVHSTLINEEVTNRRLTKIGEKKKVKPSGVLEETKIEVFRHPNTIEKGHPHWEVLTMIRDYMKNTLYQPIRMTDVANARQICVAIRKRPFNRKEIQQKEIDVISIPNKGRVIVHEPKQKVDLKKYLENHEFRFDYGFDESADNEIVYQFTARPLVHSIFKGGVASCFAYGQTGSGKTHTMGGDFSSKKQQNCSTGIYAFATRDVFDILKTTQFELEDLVVTASFFEIYGGRVIDLVNSKVKLRVLEDGKQQVQIVGLQEHNVESIDDVLRLIQIGNNNRSSGQTSANQNSSRSHAIFQINLRKRLSGHLHGKFSIIDLAGNERGADTMSACRKTRMEGAEINKSLLALKECIRALSFKSSHLPFRSSTLTQVLRDSFVGENSKTCMIAMVSPGMTSCEHTLNTLRYANRVKELEVDLKHNGKGAEAASETLMDYEPMEVSNEYYSFHEVISQIKETEENVLSYHKQFREINSNWMQIHTRLIEESNRTPTYDIDGYVEQLQIILHENLDAVKAFIEKVDDLAFHLKNEETLSQSLKKQACK